MQLINSGKLVIQRRRIPAAFIHLRTLFSTMKPNIVALTLVAAIAGGYVGARGFVADWSVLAWLMVTLGLATAGACMLNNVYDQDIDRLMGRTKSRAMAAGEISSTVVLVIGLLLAVVPLVLMAHTVNTLAALLTAGAVFGYVVVYTIWAKRRTPWANQLGGIAGAMPPLVGCAAFTGGLNAEAFILFLIMVVWQQPHALTLALKYREEYARAGVPVIPVAKGIAATKTRIVIYAALLVAVSILPYFMGMTGISYLIVALASGLIFTAKSYRFMNSDKPYDMRLFLYTLMHFVLLFAGLLLNIRGEMVAVI